MKRLTRVLLAFSLVGLAANPAHAAAILSPVGATASSEFNVFFDIGNTIDQSGLSSNFVSGVTDFDAYLAGNPSHTFVAANFEWFTAAGVTSATVTYDLGATYFVDRFALWNDEAAGINLFDVQFSTDGIGFTTVASGLSPTNHPVSAPDYTADVFGVTAGNVRYVRINALECPQSDSVFNGCGMGEIAFSVSPAQVDEVPEPASLMLLGFGALGLAARRFKRA